MKNYEDREKEVLAENQQLRKTMFEALKALNAFQNGHLTEATAEKQVDFLENGHPISWVS